MTRVVDNIMWKKREWKNERCKGCLYEVFLLMGLPLVRGFACLLGMPLGIWSSLVYIAPRYLQISRHISFSRSAILPLLMLVCCLCCLMDVPC